MDDHDLLSVIEDASLIPTPTPQIVYVTPEPKDLQLTPAMVSAFLKGGRVKAKGLRSQKTGKAYDADVVMEMKDGSPRFRLEFDSKAH